MGSDGSLSPRARSHRGSLHQTRPCTRRSALGPAAAALAVAWLVACAKGSDYGVEGDAGAGGSGPGGAGAATGAASGSGATGGTAGGAGGSTVTGGAAGVPGGAGAGAAAGTSSGGASAGSATAGTSGAGGDAAMGGVGATAAVGGTAGSAGAGVGGTAGSAGAGVGGTAGSAGAGGSAGTGGADCVTDTVSCTTVPGRSADWAHSDQLVGVCTPDAEGSLEGSLDGDEATRWNSCGYPTGGDAWVVYDFGCSLMIESVFVSSEGGWPPENNQYDDDYGRGITVEVSDDYCNWSPTDSTDIGGAVNLTAPVNAQGRFVRITETRDMSAIHWWSIETFAATLSLP